MLTASEDNGPDTQQAFLLMILLIACLTPLFTYEMQTDMLRIISPTKHGRGKVFYSKIFLGVLISSFVYMFIYAPEFFNVLSTYGTKAIDAPAISMSHLNELPFSMSILQYLIFISFVRYLGILLVGLVIYYLSVRLKSLITVALTATAVLALSILFSIINIALFDYLLITPLLTANVLFKEYSLIFLQNYRGFWLIFTALVLIISYFVFFKLLRKRYIR